MIGLLEIRFMDCTELGKQMERLFRHADASAFLDGYDNGRLEFDWVENPAAREHLGGCVVCATLLARYLRLREQILPEAHPCVHLAIEAAEGSFILMQRGFYLIHGKPKDNAPESTRHWQMRKFISHCPWCGVKVPKIYSGNLDDLYGD
jgi:hypothetical protein